MFYRYNNLEYSKMFYRYNLEYSKMFYMYNNLEYSKMFYRYNNLEYSNMFYRYTISNTESLSQADYYSWGVCPSPLSGYFQQWTPTEKFDSF